MAKKKEKKVFVLDTSVLLFDHRSIKNFAEHDVAIPITVLEEVDRFKKGNDVINFEAREFIRMLDELSQSNSLQDWLPLAYDDVPEALWPVALRSLQAHVEHLAPS